MQSLDTMISTCRSGIKADLLADGYNEKEATFISNARVDNAVSVIDGVREDLSGNKIIFKLRKVMSLSLIENYIKTWKESTREQRSEILEGLGFDTLHYNWIESVGEYTDADGSRKVGRYIAGSERTDKTWIDMRLPSGERCASEEAVDIWREKNDRS